MIPQTGASTGYAVEYSLYLYEDSVQAVLHLTPKAGGPERVFMLETSTTEFPPIAYYHTDHLGTPKALTDPAQNVVWWAEYEPFGKANITTELVTNNLRFPGQYFDAETGLHYNYFRTYDPKTGRYVESDPIGLRGGLNTYAYAKNNALIYIDPPGLTAIVFDPSSGILTVDPEVKGREPYTMPASSGVPNCGCDSSSPDKGRIPSGDYSIDTTKVSILGTWEILKRNRPKFMGGGDWGSFNAPLTPGPNTNTYNRKGFYLHGGMFKGSAGCIDVGGGLFGNSVTEQLVNDILGDPDKTVPVKVLP